MRGAINFCDLANSANTSSLGAMIGNRSGGFPEILLRRFCITRLTVMELWGMSVKEPGGTRGHTYRKLGIYRWSMFEPNRKS